MTQFLFRLLFVASLGFASFHCAQAGVLPRVVSAASLNGSSVGVCFSDALQPASATTRTNYRLPGAAVVTGATLRPDGRSVALSVSGLTGTNFILSVSNVLTALGVPVPGNTVTGLVQGLITLDIGAPTDAGTTFTCEADRFEVTAGGYDIWDFADQFRFVGRQRSGDFDVSAQLEAIDTLNFWSRSGIMLRESLAASSRHLLAWGAPPGAGANVYKATTRTITGGFSSEWGSRPGPVTPPNAWVRLKRSGDNFFAYHSTDGLNWILHGATTMNLPVTCYLGLATSASELGVVGQLSRVIYSHYSDFAPPDLRVTIIQHPQSQTRTIGQTASFLVEAEAYSGTNRLDAAEFEYQWQKNFTSIPGATAAGYMTPPLTLSDRSGLTLRVLDDRDP